MITSFKERSVKQGQLVEVYRNLHNGKFSIRDAKTKLVLAHGTNFALENVVGIVNEAGRQRVLDEKRKNVHAFLRGNLNLHSLEPTPTPDLVVYNPYRLDRFVIQRGEEQKDFTREESIWINEIAIYVIKEERENVNDTH